MTAVFVASLSFANAQALMPQAINPAAMGDLPEAPLFDAAAPVPDVNKFPVLGDMVKGGAKLYPMGARSGLFGWLIVQDGKMQMVYATPDGQSVLIGALFSGEGAGVTEAQINALAASNREIAALLNTANRLQTDIKNVGAYGGAAVLPAKSAGGGALGVPGAPISPGERLMQDLLAAAGVTLGHNDDAQLTMVIDPNCPHCQETWKELRDSVKSNAVQVRLIPIGAKDSENARAAAELLQVANPQEAWDKYVNGDKSALAGSPDAIRVRAVGDNLTLVDNWNIRATPYIVYRAKDGRIKIVQGKPERIAAVLSDLLK